jgi:uncharacterized protein YceH (UPF0502 family)
MDESRRHGDLNAHEARVLGCLIEKEATTPDAYPLTANGLRTACNQTTSRHPVMTMTDGDVDAALTTLRERGLTRTVHSTSNRAVKYRHVVPETFALEPPETALIAVLMLRGAQTVGELKSRSERQFCFGSIDDVGVALDGLARRATPLVRRLDRQPGQKDARWIELLSEPDATSDVVVPSPATPVHAQPVADPDPEATAEFHDLLDTERWEALGLQLLDLLDGVDPADGPIVDLGAGTGIGFEAITAAVPGASIWAIEPSRSMRIALHTRLVADAGLRRVTTVDPRPWGSARLPDQASALVAAAVLGCLDRAERCRLWRYVAEQMPVGAPAVIELLPPERPFDSPMTKYRELAVGEYVYEGWRRGAPVDERDMDWTMEYRVRRGAEQVAVSTVRSRWTCLGVDDLRAEITPFGLSLVGHEECVVVRR